VTIIGDVLAPRILIVEDDSDLRRLLIGALQDEGLEAEGVGTGAEMIERASAEMPDALVVDIGLPDADGRDVCQALRARGMRAPVLFLTARDALPDRLSGFSAGGDDYVTKPFALAEVVARLHALVRRGGGDQAVELEGIRLDPSGHAVSQGEQVVTLTPTEFRLLGALVGRRGEVLRRRELIRVAWPEGAIVHDNTLDTYFARIRRKLRQLPGAPEVETVYGVGYVIR
jgi:two-component system, OmpR family, response regulator